MSSKTMYYLAVFVGSIVGGYIPTLWGADWLSFSSIIFSAIGSMLGIIIVYKSTNG